MRWGSLSIVAVASVALACAACGGAKRQTVKDPGDTPPPSGNEEPPKWEGASSTPPPEDPMPKGGAPVEEPKQRAGQYDKEETEIVLTRAARQVKANCGASTDENGKATGPWGKTTIQVALGRNGHSKGVTLPTSFQGKPSGRCIEQAFSNLTFPPWAGSDTTVDWEVEVVQPAAAGK